MGLCAALKGGGGGLVGYFTIPGCLVLCEQSSLVLLYDLTSTPASTVLCLLSCCAPQAYSMLHAAADGKLPRITAVLHLEAFHALCQHPDLVTKVRSASRCFACVCLVVCRLHRACIL
jgi:hypothetical protein